VRAIALSWVAFTDGYRCDVEAIGRACRAAGAYFVVDAIQGLGAHHLDVRACNIDVLACGAQKWLLSPWGTGFTYVRDALVAELEPHMVGWTAVRGGDDFSRLLDYDLTWRQDARRFESLTLPVHDFFGFNESVALLSELGLPAVAAHIESLASLVVAWAAERPHVELATPADPRHRAGIVSLRLEDARGASARLTSAGVAHSMREGLIRLSPHCFNTAAEVQRALAVLDRA
jgi:selenocysteine lyase/cysteine desulfurase